MDKQHLFSLSIVLLVFALGLRTYVEVGKYRAEKRRTSLHGLEELQIKVHPLGECAGKSWRPEWQRGAESHLQGSSQPRNAASAGEGQQCSSCSEQAELLHQGIARRRTPSRDAAAQPTHAHAHNTHARRRPSARPRPHASQPDRPRVSVCSCRIAARRSLRTRAPLPHAQVHAPPVPPARRRRYFEVEELITRTSSGFLRGQPGSFPPHALRAQNRTLTVVEGTLEYEVYDGSGQVLRAGPGDTVFIPHGEHAHCLGAGYGPCWRRLVRWSTSPCKSRTRACAASPAGQPVSWWLAPGPSHVEGSQKLEELQADAPERVVVRVLVQPAGERTKAPQWPAGQNCLLQCARRLPAAEPTLSCACAAGWLAHRAPG